jgi:hypothetical protein
MNTTPNTVIGLNQDETHTLGCQCFRSLQASNPGADDHHIWIGGCIADCEPWYQCGCGKDF